jgi:hypothetical protein
MVLRIHGMDEAGVRFPVGPQIMSPEKKPQIVEPGGRWVGGIEMRPTKKDLDNLQITPELWARAQTDFEDDIDFFIKAAQIHRDRGVSHRTPPFLVGAVAVGIEPNQPEGHFGTYQAANFTPTPGQRTGDDKMCAESNALNAGLGWSKVIVGLITLSRETHTGDPTQAHDVLHPCLECRKKFRKFIEEGYMRNDTLLYSVNDADPNNIKKERKILKEILDLYKDD